ncbi:MAG: alpha-amylase family glycosyl hydrolase [Candidatus Shapirobacteria bacterium]
MIRERNINIPDSIDISHKSTLPPEFGDWLKPSEIGHHQTLYLINTRLWIDQLSKKYDQPITIDTVPDSEWNDLFGKYDYFWFMGIYTPSTASQEHAKKWCHEFRYALPDLDPNKDVAASPFAIPEYTPNPKIAKNWEAWDVMVDKLHQHGKKVMIDFVPNHTALDSKLVRSNPEYFIQGNQDQYNSNLNLFCPVVANDGQTYYIAHGKDPNYPEWADTLQLNYGVPELHEEMAKQLIELSRHSDGVRCDMAMLLDPSTFIRTWGWILSEKHRDFIQQHSFWQEKIPLVKTDIHQQFDFLGEIYWDKEYLGQVFDYIYNQDFYKILHESPQTIKSQIQNLLTAEKNGRHYHDTLYIENHDEERASRILGPKLSKAAAVLAGIIPNSIFMVNQGQEMGLKIRPPMQISRFPDEETDTDTQIFYDKLLHLFRSRLFRQGEWNLADINSINGDTIALKVLSPDKKIGAIVCINPYNNYARCTIPEITTQKNVEVVSLTESKNIVVDMVRSNGIFIGLDPGEVQVVYFSDINSIEVFIPESNRHNLSILFEPN